jgi:hypothetical protein
MNARLKVPRRQRPRWMAAYRRTEYVVLLAEGELVLRIGRLNPPAQGRLRREAGVRSHWAIVTPCNPGSRQLDWTTNAARLEAFEIAIVDGGVRSWPSINRDPLRSWPDEPGFLICDPETGYAECLGRQYEQNAILVGRLGEPSQLVWL